MVWCGVDLDGPGRDLVVVILVRPAVSVLELAGGKQLRVVRREADGVELFYLFLLGVPQLLDELPRGGVPQTDRTEARARRQNETVAGPHHIEYVSCGVPWRWLIL